MEGDQDFFDPYTHAYETESIEPENLDAITHPHPEAPEVLEPQEFSHEIPESLDPLVVETPEVESLDPIEHPADGVPAESLEPLDFSPSEVSELELATPSAEVPDLPDTLDPIEVGHGLPPIENIEPLDFDPEPLPTMEAAQVQVPPWTRHFPGPGYRTAQTHWGR